MSKTYYLLISAICFVLLSIALYLQHIGFNGIHYPPCPLCILQRIGFLLVGLGSLGAFLFSAMRLPFHLLSCLGTIFGLGVAIRHAYVIAYPEISCGLDPLEVFINQFSIVQLFPFFFKADGFCSMPLPSFLGLSIPNWSLLWFLIFTCVLTVFSFRLKK